MYLDSIFDLSGLFLPIETKTLYPHGCPPVGPIWVSQVLRQEYRSHKSRLFTRVIRRLLNYYVITVPLLVIFLLFFHPLPLTLSQLFLVFFVPSPPSSTHSSSHHSLDLHLHQPIPISLPFPHTTSPFESSETDTDGTHRNLMWRESTHVSNSPWTHFTLSKVWWNPKKTEKKI